MKQLILLSFLMLPFFSHAQLHGFEITGGLHASEAIVPDGYTSSKEFAFGYGVVPFHFGFEWYWKAPHSFQLTYDHLAFHFVNDSEPRGRHRYSEQFGLLYNRILLSNQAKSLLLKGSVGPSLRFWNYEVNMKGGLCDNACSSWLQLKDAYGVQVGFSGKAILKKRISLTGSLSVAGFLHDELPINATADLSVGYLFSL